jgi:hypothetical protein
VTARVPPHDLAAEESLLGAMLLSVGAIRAAETAGVTAADFYKPEHAQLCAAILALDADGIRADVTTVTPRLNGSGPSRERIRAIQAATPASANASAYAAIVRETARRRDVLVITNRIDSAIRAGDPIERLLAELSDLRDPDEDERDSSWERVDLATAIADGVERVMPTVLRRDDGCAILYRGRVNGVHGDSGVGKSMVLAVAAAQEMQSGAHVGWVDLEDPDPSTLIERLQSFGVDDATIIERLHYWAPREPFTDRAVAALALAASELSMLVIDSMGEATALEGLDENLDKDVGPWLRRVARVLADAGPAVCLVDHSTKANDNPLHPSGSKRKRAAITGASYLVDIAQPLSRERGGRLKLVTAKDRHGNYRRGDIAATVDLAVYPDGGVSVKVWAPLAGATGDDSNARLRRLASHAVSIAKDSGTPITQSLLVEKMPKARAELKRAAIDLAVHEGALRTEAGPQRRILLIGCSRGRCLFVFDPTGRSLRRRGRLRGTRRPRLWTFTWTKNGL